MGICIFFSMKNKYFFLIYNFFLRGFCVFIKAIENMKSKSERENFFIFFFFLIFLVNKNSVGDSFLLEMELKSE